ncbi:hypothetical protein [Frankia sp. Cj3]|uniref:hypothetical protein n=1 Tax=Frankia sp. Cj3 TaxID=2880976 RepID=UPI001EF534DA|nr:hypothetical protein [Frankia sp. Cj3]
MDPIGQARLGQGVPPLLDHAVLDSRPGHGLATPGILTGKWRLTTTVRGHGEITPTVVGVI